jgi:hypothetical protein
MALKRKLGLATLSCNITILLFFIFFAFVMHVCLCMWLLRGEQMEKEKIRV